MPSDLKDSAVTSRAILLLEFRLGVLWKLLGWLLIVIVIFLSLYPVKTPIVVSYGDKLQHVLAYATMMFWFANLYASTHARTGYAFGFIGLGIALEFIQQWTGYRTFDVADMIANAIGVTIGWLLAPPRTPPMLETIESLLFRSSSGDDV